MKPGDDKIMPNGLTVAENDELQILEYIELNKAPLTPWERARRAELEGKEVEAAIMKISITNGYTELMVLKSAAGFYVGTAYVEDGRSMPGTRDSGYFATKYEAGKCLRKMLQGEAAFRKQP